MKIGLIRIDKMGDMILTLPVIKSIKLINSSIEVDVFTSNQNHKVLKNFKYINKIINIDNKSKLNEKIYDYLFSFSPGWKSFFLCIKIKARKKANLIFTSRYKSNDYSKFLIMTLSKMFFNKTILVNRKKRFINNQSIHQTQMMFDLISKFNIAFNKEIQIEKYLPKKRILKSEKKICLVHLSSKWINNFYTEIYFLDLIKSLEKKFNLILTTDETTTKKFKLIFDKFQIIDNDEFINLNNIKNTTLLKNLNFLNWVQSIYSSNLIITPECGCSHVAALCKIPSKIIYDPNNKPNMIYAEYSPWQSTHEKYIFNNPNLNSLLIKNL